MGPYSPGSEHPSPNGVAVTMAPPNLYSSALGSGSPDPISPLTTHRGESAVISSFQASSKIHVSHEHIFDKNSEITKGPSFPRIVPLESRDSRIPSSNNHTFLNDPKVLQNRSSPPQNFRRANRPSTALLHHEASISSSSSSISSNLSSNITTPTSIYTPITSMEDIRSQRSLPPLSTTGHKFMASGSYVEPNGRSNHSSFSNQSAPYVLPVPQNSPFISSSSSPGRLQTLFHSRSHFPS